MEKLKELKKLSLRSEVKDNSFAGRNVSSKTFVSNFFNFSNFSNSYNCYFGSITNVFNFFNFYNFCNFYKFNNMKKTFHFALMAVLTVGLSFAVTSCKDDDNSDNNGGQATAEEQAAEDANTFWAVAANLVSPFDVTSDYENKTFEPTIGSPLNGNSTIRVVSTGDMSAAAKRFADLTGAPVDENTTTYTYEDDAVGTLVYTKTNDATSLAKVDVSIKQIPHLQQIVYKTPEQMGTNGTFKGNSYYSFGDIILRYNQDDQPEYWVCVRPALGPAGKEDTHWMTVSKLPDDNIRLLEENRKVVAAVPTQLGKSEEHMQNLAEMLYAMFNPDQWQSNIEEYSDYGILGAKGLPIFHDMKPERVQYFNKYFWTLLEKDWEKNELFQMIFGYSAEQMKGYVNSADGLFLLGKGYTGTAGLYQWQFKNGDGSKSNLHDMKYSVVKKTGNALENAKLYYDNQYKNNHWVNEAFFGDPNPRFVIRIATGKQLAGQDPGPRFSLATNTNKITDTFVFNNEHNVTISPNIDPKVYTEADANPDMVTNKTADDKMGVYIPGDVVKDEQGTRWFCIMGSGYNESGKILDDRAWFISLEGISMTDGTPTNILTEKQAPEVGFRLLKLMSYVRTNQNYSVTDSKAFIAKNIYDYTKVNIGDLFVMRDSVWRFKDNKTTKYFNSHSKNLMTNLAYIGNDGELKLLRCVFDHTQAGNQRTYCQPASGKGDFQYHHFYFYKHYMNSDPTSWRALTDDESSLEMTRYMTPWPVTNEEILFSDLGNQAKVDQWAAKDKWVTLPLVDLANPGADYTKREQPRTRAYSNPRALNFVMTENGTFIDHLGMYNEPVLFVRVMTVKDAGGNRATLESEDGRKLTVVHLQDDLTWYKGMNNFVEALAAINVMKFTDLDNEPYTIDFKHGN